MQRFDVLGVQVDALTPVLATDRIAAMIREATKATVAFCTVSTVVNAQSDAGLREALADATLVTPDGMPLVWLGRRRDKGVERVYGPDFMLDFFSRTGPEFGHFFYGGAEGVADEMVVRLKERFPDLRIAGTATPPQELDPRAPDGSDIQEINRSRADIVWIGLGHPKQEIFMHANRSRLEAPVLAAVGAAFDFHAGRKKEAPQWMKKSGLQWVHRLYSEPRRLWRRYLIGNSRFIYLLVRQALRGK